MDLKVGDVLRLDNNEQVPVSYFLTHSGGSRIFEGGVAGVEYG